MILEKGTLLGERYEIIEKIGAGGMSIVYKAKCHKLQRYVAVKVLREEFIQDEVFVDKFKVEALSAASLSHPNIVGIYDVGKSDDVQYIVMEYVDGITLKQYIAQEGALDSQKVLDYGIQMLSAIKHAHQKQIIHRDIKPQNILVTQEGVLKVTDFGIARAVDSSTIVATGNAIGSVHYFSPEQAKGKYIDQTSDVYSCGIVLFELATGRLPFEADSHVSIALKHINEELPSIDEFVSGTYPALQNIIKKATQKKQSERYQDAQVMINDMQEAKNNPNHMILSNQALQEEHTVQLTKEDTEYLRNNEKLKTMGAIESEQRKMVEEREEEEMYEEDKEEEKISPIYKILTIVGGIFAGILIIGIAAVWGISYVLNGGLFNSKAATSNEIVVPKVENYQVEQAEAILEDLGLRMNIIGYEESDQPAGTVISQTPKEGLTTAEGRVVEVVVAAEEGSDEPEEFTMPNVVNQRGVEAQVDLTALGLKVEVSRRESDTVENGNIIEQTPQAGATVKEGDTVVLVVSTGQDNAPVRVPSVIGTSRSNAEAVIRNAGLSIGNIGYENSDQYEEGIVIYQSQPAENMVSPGTSIDIIVSLGPEIPDEEIPDEENPDEEIPDEEIPDEENPDEEIPVEEPEDGIDNLVTKTHIIKLPDHLQESEQEEFHVMIVFEGNEGTQTVYEARLQKEQFPMPVQVTGSGSGRLMTYFDTNNEWNDPFSFE